MGKYIDKDVLVAEIERRIAENKKDIERASHSFSANNLEDYFEGYEDALALFKQQFLDSLEVKEVDLEKEYDEEFFKDPVFGKLVNRSAGIVIAKHFFELGLKAQKGE